MVSVQEKELMRAVDARLSGSRSREELMDVIRETLADQEPLLVRDMVKVDAGGADLRVMQWNMLAQALACSDDSFVKCPPAALAWPKRRLYVLQEILHYDPDVVCLQEVDNFKFINDMLTKVGYEGHFRSKLDSPCNYVTPNFGPDGCACFWKKEKIELVRKEDFILAPDNNYTNQIALFVTLKLGDFKFGVIGTHLKAKPPYFELRHSQGASILQYLKDHAKDLPVVVCGDFNGTVDELFYKDFSTSDLDLLSTYTKLSDDGNEPPYTTWKIRAAKKPGEPCKDVCRTIDYLWCSRKKFEVAGLLKMPAEAEVGEDRLPSHGYPSDHLSLVADLRIKPAARL